MTDRYHSLTVAFEKDMRDDEAEALIGAIKQLRGVVGVEGNVVDPSCYAHRVRNQVELGELLRGLQAAIARAGVDEVIYTLESVKGRPVL